MRQMSFCKKDTSDLVIYLFCVISLMLVYFVGTSGPFLLDDFESLNHISFVSSLPGVDGVYRYVLGQEGSDTSRWLSRLSFLIDAQSWPAPAQPFKQTNIFLHILNGLVLALVLLRVFPEVYPKKTSRRLALCVSFVWMALPVNVSTVLYVVQRMTELMVFFLLLTVYFFVLARSADSRNQILCLVASGVCAFLSVSGKINGALILILVPLVSYFLKETASRWLYPRLMQYAMCASVLVFLMLFSFEVYHNQPGFLSRVFTVWDRLLIQSLVLFDYQVKIIFAFGNLSVFLDQYEYMVVNDFPIWRASLLWVYHLSVISLAIKYRNKAKLACFGILWFYACHTIESTVLPLELAFDHRNYLPSMGLVLSGAAFVLFLVKRILKSEERIAAHCIVFSMPVYYFISLTLLCCYWADPTKLAIKWSEENPNSFRSQIYHVHANNTAGLPEAGLVLLDEMKKKFDDPSIELQTLYLQCANDWELTKIDAKSLASKNFSSGVLHWMERLMSMSAFECYDQAIEPDFSSLVDAVFDMPYLADKDRYIAKYANIASGYYIFERNYANAVRAGEMAWRYQRSAATAMKLVELFVLGGDLENARVYLNEASLLRDKSPFADAQLNSDIKNLNDIVLHLEGKEAGD